MHLHTVGTLPRVILIAILLATLLSGCVHFEVGIEQTEAPNLYLTATVDRLVRDNSALATLVSLPTATPSPTSTLSPDITVTPRASVTPTPVLENQPHFTNLRFAVQPTAAVTQRFFVEGTPRLYAILDYENMEAGMTWRRLWTRNGEVWLDRTEPWDFGKYGKSGTVRDISIFEETVGLEAGEYTLSLFINDVVQDMGTEPVSQTQTPFWIFPSDVPGPVASPDKRYTAYVVSGGRLVLEDADGRRRDMAITQEISSVAWFPDSRHLLYADRDRSGQANEIEDWGITHKLYVLDIVSGEKHVVGTAGENFHTPQISPSGRYIAVLAGSTLRSGCVSSPVLAFLDLDSEFRRQGVYLVTDFTGLPGPDPKGGVFPDDRRDPGRWEDKDRFTTSLWWSCLPTSAIPDGRYLFDLPRKTAEFIGE